jgi:L,D-transpeptidase ErfK/SrfK
VIGRPAVKINALVGVVIVWAGATLASVPAERADHQPAATTGARFVHTVEPGQSLTHIGARFGIDVRGLARVNGLARDARLRVGQQLTVDARHVLPASAGTEIVINIPQRMLFVFRDGRLDVAYPVGLGRPSWPTFTGAFTVERVEPDPIWDVPRSIQEEMRRSGEPVRTQVPAGPDNPLGAFWVGLSRPGFGIHGTNAPASIFHFQTHGCIRLHPDDINDLAGRATAGMAGRTIYEPVLFAVTAGNVVLVEVHQDIYRRAGDLRRHARAVAEKHGLTQRVNWTMAEAAISARDGVVTDVTVD